MEPPESHTFYRVVTTNPPTEGDFRSYEALGKPLRSRKPTGAELASWRAVSTYVSQEQARRRAQQNAAIDLPIGDYIAKLVISPDAAISIGHINERSGHCDLAGEPSALLGAVVSVVEV